MEREKVRRQWVVGFNEQQKALNSQATKSLQIGADNILELLTGPFNLLLKSWPSFHHSLPVLHQRVGF